MTNEKYVIPIGFNSADDSDLNTSIDGLKMLKEKGQYIFNDKIFTVKDMDDNISIQSENIVKNSLNYVKKYYKPSPICMRNYFFKRLPFFDWVFDYNVKEDLLKDFIAGLTVRIFSFFLFEIKSFKIVLLNSS